MRQRTCRLPRCLCPAACAVLLSVSCVSPSGLGLMMPLGTVAVYGAPFRIAELSDRRIAEASGIAASRRTPGLYYIHNDSGDAARVFLVNESGETVATLSLGGARNVDYEDIAIAPGVSPGTFDVCVADIGDNSARRSEVSIYRFAEVDPAAVSDGVQSVQATEFRFRYEDGPRDAEGFVVHPQTGDGYVFSKRTDGQSDVYLLAAPWNLDGVATAPKIASLSFPLGILPLVTMVTGADISPDGRRLATRSYVGGWEWTLASGVEADGFASIFDSTPLGLQLAVELQGEAIGYAADGDSILTVSEHVPTPLHQIRRLGANE